MTPRRDRWFLLIDLATILEPVHPRLGTMTRATKRKFIYRLVRKLERVSGRKYAKQIGRDLYVSRVALLNLLPSEHVRAIDELEEEQLKIATVVKRHSCQINDHAARIKKLEQKQKLTSEYLHQVSALD